MPPRFPNRLGRWLLLAFALGVAGGFGWALVRRHPASAYREALARAIAENDAASAAELVAEDARTDPDEEPDAP